MFTKKLPEYVESLTVTEEELNKYIIGTISPLEQPKSAVSKGMAALSRLKTDFSAEDIVALKEEILATKSAQLSDYAKEIEKVLEDASVVVIGNKAQIEEEKNLFDEIYTLY